MGKKVLIEKIEERVSIPENINVEIVGNRVSVKSGKGELSREFPQRKISIKKEGKEIIVSAAPPTRATNALVKTVVSHIKNLITGLEKGFEYKLAIVYSHFPMTVNVKGKVIEIGNFSGEKKPRLTRIVGNTQVAVKGKEITVSGNNIEEVSQTATNIENATRINNRDRRVFQDGIFLVSKGVKGEEK